MAAADGKVKFVGVKGGFGKQVILSHKGGYRTYYGHLSKFRRGLRAGKKVKRKQIIGYVGSTGLSTGPHLDYRLRHHGKFKNPFAIKFKPRSVLKGSKLARFQESTAHLAQLMDSTDKGNNILLVRTIIVSKENKIAFL